MNSLSFNHLSDRDECHDLLLMSIDINSIAILNIVIVVLLLEFARVKP